LRHQALDRCRSRQLGRQPLWTRFQRFWWRSAWARSPEQCTRRNVKLVIIGTSAQLITRISGARASAKERGRPEPPLSSSQAGSRTPRLPLAWISQVHGPRCGAKATKRPGAPVRGRLYGLMPIMQSTFSKFEGAAQTDSRRTVATFLSGQTHFKGRLSRPFSCRQAKRRDSKRGRDAWYWFG
jgi:hypothetical protein